MLFIYQLHMLLKICTFQVVEAYQDFVPLLLLTADRPSELHDVGANQAINQVYMEQLIHPYDLFSYINKSIQLSLSYISMCLYLCYTGQVCFWNWIAMYFCGRLITFSCDYNLVKSELLVPCNVIRHPLPCLPQSTKKYATTEDRKDLMSKCYQSNIFIKALIWNPIIPPSG